MAQLLALHHDAGQRWGLAPGLGVDSAFATKNAAQPSARGTGVGLSRLDRSGDVVTRDELAGILYGLNSAVRRLRHALGDSAERPVFVETVPRVGYRFMGTVDKPAAALPEMAEAAENAAAGASGVPRTEPGPSPARISAGSQRRWHLVAAAIVLAAASIVAWRGKPIERSAAASYPEPIPLTFEGGFGTDPSISPDGQWIAYTSDAAGNFDIWIRRLSGGDPVQVTRDEAADYQPDWSPDSSRLVFRSERSGGGLFIVPVTGGAEWKVSDVGFRPRWSPDGLHILSPSES